MYIIINLKFGFILLESNLKLSSPDSNTFKVIMSHSNNNKSSNSRYDNTPLLSSSDNSSILNFITDYGIRIKSVEILGASNDDTKLPPYILHYEETVNDQVKKYNSELYINILNTYTQIGNDKYITSVEIEIKLDLRS